MNVSGGSQKHHRSSFGLHSKALNKMFAYNHKQAEWRELAAMKTPRSMFGAVVHNGKIVVAGGVNEEGLTATCEAYDFATNKYDCLDFCTELWSPAQPAAFPGGLTGF